ncbi:MAG: hypothetical protein AB7I19_02035 [Planctomycetota bacterium]
MVRRSLQILLGCVILVVAFTLGYAALGFSGPEKHIAAARKDFDAGRFTDCIRLLDLNEASLGPNAPVTIRKELLALRWTAHEGAGNWRLALRDVRKLREIQPEDLDLSREEIRFSILADEAESALSLADAFLVAHPDDGAVLGLAGDACQALYQPMIADLLARLRSGLDPKTANEAIAALRSWLYRDPRDPLASLSLDRFREIVRTTRRELLSAILEQHSMDEIHGLIQRSQSYYRRSLEQPDAPITAFRGVAFALREGLRDDDRQWLGELYLLRFRDTESVTAATDLLELHLGRERYRAVIAVADSYLPPGTWKARLDEGSIDGRIQEVYLAKARALNALGRGDELGELAEEVRSVVDDQRIVLEPAASWIFAMEARAREDFGGAMRYLGMYDDQLRRLGADSIVVGRRIQVLEERVAIARLQNWGPQFFESINRTLAALEPTNPRRYLEQSYFHIEGNDPASALIDVRSARRVDNQNEEVLRVEATLRNEQYKGSSRDARSLLERCIQLGQLLPADASDEILPLIAEEALARNRPDIARNCADVATRRIPWARWPRHLLVQAQLALGDGAGAERAARDYLAFHPGHEEALVDLRLARQAIKASHDDLLVDLLLTGRRDGAIAADLLRIAAAEGQLGVARHLAATVEQSFNEDPDAMLAVADVYERLGQLEDAQRALSRVSGTSIARDPTTFANSFARLVAITARTTEDPAILGPLVNQFVVLHAEDTGALTQMAQDLRAARHPALAYLVITPVLTEDVHRPKRNGQHFLLAGRLAMQLHMANKAERHLIAALAFPDGQEASRELTLLQLADGREVDAANSYWESDVNDLVSACLAARFNGVARARGWVRGRLEAVPSDLSALALAAALGVDRGLPNPASNLAREQNALLLDALTFVDAPGFETVAIERLVQLLEVAKNDPIARTLRARVVHRMGQTSVALDLLRGVVRDEPLLVPAYDEIASIAESSGVDLFGAAGLGSEFVRPELLASGLQTPAMLAVATRAHVRELLGQLGGTEQIDQLLGVWMASAASGSVGLPQVDLLLSLDRPDLALTLAESIESSVPAEQRDRFLATYFLAAELALARTPNSTRETALRNKAEEVVRQEGPKAPAINFIIDREIAANGPLVLSGGRERVMRAVAAYQEYFASLRRDSSSGSQMGLERALARFAELRGRAAALEILDERLAASPVRLTLWELRAKWLMAEGDSAQALQSLRWVYTYLPDHPIVLLAIELAARSGQVVDADRRAFQRVGTLPALGQSEQAKLAGLILAIRAADYAKAAELATAAVRSDDGAHLYFGALAQLLVGKPDPAAALLDRLATDFPESSVAAGAQHFVRQLRVPR